MPFLVAAMAPRALRVSGELADGILPLVAGPRALAEHVIPAVTAATASAGRPTPRIVAFVPGAVTADVEAVRKTVTETLAFYERFPSYQRIIGLSGATRAADLAVIGDEKTVAAEVRRYCEADAPEVVFTATDLGGEADRRRTWKLLGELPNGWAPRRRGRTGEDSRTRGSPESPFGRVTGTTGSAPCPATASTVFPWVPLASRSRWTSATSADVTRVGGRAGELVSGVRPAERALSRCRRRRRKQERDSR